MNAELLSQMLQLSNQLAQTRDLDNLLNLAMGQTLELMGAEYCYLILLGPGGEIQFRVRSGFVDATIDDLLSQSILDEVVKSAEPLVVTDALSDERYASKSSIIDLNIRSVMCVPLIVHGEILGAIYVENRQIVGAFRADDLEPLIFFANQAAVSIENSLIIANLEDRVATRTAEVEKGWSDAVEANKMRTIFLGQLAHDMRTPASIIKMSLGMLDHEKVGALNEPQQTWVTRASHGLDQMTDLIDNVFYLAQSESGELEISREMVELQPFLEQCYEIGMALPWPETVRFRSELPPILPEIAIDRVRIQQVLMNLISNALKFTEFGKVVLHARMTDGGTVEIGVRDTGEGIPDDAQTHIFERFRQFDQDPSRRASGAGLGLAICRELVEKHGGRIWVSSAPSQGSDFVFSLSS